jgi:hypothetical protein
MFGTSFLTRPPPATAFYLALIHLTDGDERMAHLRLAPQVRAPQGFRQARLTVSRQAEKRAAGETPAPKILGIRLCGPAGIETGFRDRRGQQRQGPASHKAGPLKNGRLENVCSDNALKI